MKRMVSIGLMALFIVSAMATFTVADEGTETIAPSTTYDLEYPDLHKGKKIMWEWSVDRFMLDFRLVDPDGDSPYEVFDQTSDSGSYTVPVGGDWTLVWENTHSDSPSYDYSLELTYTVNIPNSDPKAEITADPTQGDEPLAVDFLGEGMDTDGEIVSYGWDFGDGSAASTEQNPSHTYPTPGTYTVTLTVTDDDGATGTDTVKIYVKELPPNDDKDGDGMPNQWEKDNGLDPFVNDADDDKDGDGFTNIQEFKLETDPTDASSFIKGKITIYVVDKDSNAIEEVTIVLTGPSTANGTTDIKGKVEISGLDFGNFTIVVTKKGYKEVLTHTEISTDKPETEVTVTLEKSKKPGTGSTFPGFELLFLIVAIGIATVLLRRRD